jgi:hypothetical protein
MNHGSAAATQKKKKRIIFWQLNLKGKIYG